MSKTKPSKIEKMIDDIEEYIDSCKYAMFSNTNIVVDKDEINHLLSELRSKTPEEIKHYQKIVSNREAIIKDAEAKAQALIDQATAQTSELISEHEIMLRAYEQADEIVDMASAQAQQIVDNATIEANELKASAMQYTDQLLGQVEDVVSHYLDTIDGRYNSLISSLKECFEVVRDNRAELIHADPEQLLNEEVDDYIDDVSEETTSAVKPQKSAGVSSGTSNDLDVLL